MNTLARVLALALFMSAVPAAAFDDVEQIPSCGNCGMDREKFSTTRMLVEYGDGSRVGLCSIHCAAEELARNAGRTVKSVTVADYGTGRLTDAGGATWVVGADMPGVMSPKSRLAFAERQGALAFQERRGGGMMTFDEAMADTRSEIGVKPDKMKGMH